MTNTPESKDTPVTITMYGDRYKGMLREFDEPGTRPVLFIVGTNDGTDDVALPLGTIRDLFYEGARRSARDKRQVITVRINGREREVTLAEPPSEMAPEFFPGTSKIDQVTWLTPSQRGPYVHYVDPLRKDNTAAPYLAAPSESGATPHLPPPSEPSGVVLRRMMKKIDEMKAQIEELVSEVKLPEQVVPEREHVVPMEPLRPVFPVDDEAMEEARKLWEGHHSAIVLPPESTLTMDLQTQESVAVFDEQVSITMTTKRLRDVIAKGIAEEMEDRGGPVREQSSIARKRKDNSERGANYVMNRLLSSEWTKDKDNG